MRTVRHWWSEELRGLRLVVPPPYLGNDYPPPRLHRLPVDAMADCILDPGTARALLLRDAELRERRPESAARVAARYIEVLRSFGSGEIIACPPELPAPDRNREEQPMPETRNPECVKCGRPMQAGHCRVHGNRLTHYCVICVVCTVCEEQAKVPTPEAPILVIAVDFNSRNVLATDGGWLISLDTTGAIATRGEAQAGDRVILTDGEVRSVGLVEKGTCGRLGVRETIRLSTCFGPGHKDCDDWCRVAYTKEHGR